MKMRTIACSLLTIILCATLAAQATRTQAEKTARTILEGRPATLRLSPHLTTTIRLPEPVNSVIVGDSWRFKSLSGGVFSRRTATGIHETNHADCD